MKDLLKLYSFYSVHGTEDETKICDWIVSRLEELGVKYERSGNNIWSFAPYSKMLLSAHLDQVDTNGPAVHFYKTDKGLIEAYNKDWERTSLGADDKNGVWLILKMLEKGYGDFDFIISEGEEVGCVGIKAIEEHIKESDAGFAIVLDRKSNTDILKGGGSDVYCSALATNLKNFLNNLNTANNYTVTTGSISDTRVICKYIESVNMCVNYDGAHSKNETTDWNALQNTLQNLEAIHDTFIHYPSKPEEYCVKEYSYKRYSKDYNDDDYEYDLENYYGGYYGKHKRY